jgi:hypothetical protein
MKYVFYDLNNNDSTSSNIIGFYDDDIHGEYGSDGSLIPTTALSISDDTYSILVKCYNIYRIDLISKSIVNITVPSPTLSQIIDNKLTQLANYRFNIETGGITLVDGTKILTDRESQAQATSAYTSLLNGLLTNVNWKASNGWVNVTLESFASVAQIIANHVQDCFNNEKVHSDAINTLTDSQSVIDYDITIGWPSN